MAEDKRDKNELVCWFIAQLLWLLHGRLLLLGILVEALSDFLDDLLRSIDQSLPHALPDALDLAHLRIASNLFSIPGLPLVADQIRLVVVFLDDLVGRLELLRILLDSRLAGIWICIIFVNCDQVSRESHRIRE